MGVNVKKGSGLVDSGGNLIISQITVRPVVRDSADIAKFRAAQKLAEFVANPSRINLYDLMDEAMIDSHLTGIYGKRLRSVRNKRIRFVKDEKEVEGMDEFIKSKVFRYIRKRIFDSQGWGLSGLEFKPGKTVRVKEIPRKHIKPHLKAITKEQLGNTVCEGGYYEANPMLWIIENEDDTFGFLLKAIPWAIYKRGDVGDWAQYIELFGQPIRVGKYGAYDIESRSQLEEALDKAGGSLAIMIPKEADLQLIENKSSNGTGDLQEKFLNICDQQLSILVLGQTETTKSSRSSGYAQSKTHEEQQLEITQDDMDYELDWLNDEKFLNILASYGLPVEGGRFVHESKANPQKLLDETKIDEFLENTVGLPLGDDYYYKKYDRPKPDNYEELKKKKEEAKQTVKPGKGKKKQNDDEDDPEDLADSETLPGKVQAAVNRYLKKLGAFFGQAPKISGLSMNNLSAFYGTRCPHCGGVRGPELPALANTLSWIEDIAKDLHSGRLSDGSIPQALYEHTANKLMKGVFEGLGGSSFEYEDPRNEIKVHLEHNIYAFSAAKSLTELEHFRSLLVDSEGKLRGFEAFRNAVTDAGYLFNKTYLETEYDSAIACAEMAQKWQELQSLPLLEFNTVGDDRVRPTHAELDEFTAPPDDAIWGKIYPPIDWNCRCTVIPGVAKNVKSADKAYLVSQAKIPKYFQRNVGKDKVVFSNDHPYFQQAGKKLKELTAEGNYNMPSVQKLYDDNTFPPAIEVADKDEANKWWQDRSGNKRASFHTKDATGTSVKFSNEFRKHVMEANKDDRHSFIANCEDIVKAPDEVWSYKEGGAIKKTYIKYYDGAPICVKANGADAFTMFRLESEAAIGRNRRGALLYRKN